MSGTPPPERCSCIVTEDRADRARVESQLLDAVRAAGYAEASVFAIRLAFEEALSNAFKHGHRDLGDEETVEIAYTVTPQRVEIRVRDRGPGFDPGDVPDPTSPEHIERPSGRGLMLIRAYMTSLEFNEAGNELRMVYDRPS